MKFYSMEPGQYSDENPENTDNEFFGNGWSVKSTGNKYVLTYISGSIQGQLKTTEISKEDYFLARNGKIGLDELSIKYNIF